MNRKPRAVPILLLCSCMLVLGGCNKEDKNKADNDKSSEELDKSGLSEAKLTYLQYSISRMLTSQFKIYISFPLGNGMRRKMMDLDKQVKAAYPQIYSAVTNKSIWILRKSGYLLFPAAVVSFRLLKAKIK